MEITLRDGQDLMVNSSEKVETIIRSILDAECPIDQEKEHFWVIGVNTRFKVKYVELVSLGILDASVVHPREVFRFAIQKGVKGIVLAHNHPSGDPSPSQEDIRMTTQLKQAGEILGIKVFDHVVVGTFRFGFADSGLL